jgi:CRISPR-associated protein Csx14
MKNPLPSISIPVDLSNPGQFFACCGLFELADRLWPGTEGWFEPREQHSSLWIPASPSAGLADLLDGAKSLQFDVGKGTADADDSDKDNAPLEPIYIESPAIKSPLVLDWWSDRSIKPWAGSMKERLILRAMLGAIDPMDGDPLNYAKPVSDPSPPVVAGKRSKQTRKREPFYFDCRRGSNAHPLDSGFSPDTHHLESFCFPTVEALCFIGLQRARPALANVPNRLRYTAWTESVPVNAIGPVVCGIVRMPGSLDFTFDNFFRTDQRKHKSFSRSTRERSKNV